MLWSSNGKVKIQQQLTEALDIDRSLWQGDALSSVFFNIAKDKVIRSTETNPNGTICDRTRQYIAHVGDVLILGW